GGAVRAARPPGAGGGGGDGAHAGGAGRLAGADRRGRAADRSGWARPAHRGRVGGRTLTRATWRRCHVALPRARVGATLASVGGPSPPTHCPFPPAPGAH